jgi:hypothetical protein
MINKYQQLGKKLSGKEMKQVQGGLAPCHMIQCGDTYCSACHFICQVHYTGSWYTNACVPNGNA